MNLVMTVYEQQRLMYETWTHIIPRKIVSLSNSHIHIEQLDLKSYNEAEDLYWAVERYRDRYGHYPQRILADMFYHNRQTLAYCKQRNIRLTGPALGKFPKGARP